MIATTPTTTESGTELFTVVGETTVTGIPTITVTNTCECAYCPTCNVGHIGGAYEKCDDCDTTIEPSSDCFGCDDDQDYVNEQFTAWLTANSSDHGHLVTGAGMGWRGLHGTRVLAVGQLPDDVTTVIGVNSEWTQRWTIDPREGGVCEAVQSHHDAMGEVYTFHPLIGCEGDRGYLDYSYS